MIKVLFVCHGNICRSPMAEFVLKHMVKERGVEKDFVINSSATSCEELGNPVHRGTKNKLYEMGIPCGDHRAIRLKKLIMKNMIILLQWITTILKTLH